MLRQAFCSLTLISHASKQQKTQNRSKVSHLQQQRQATRLSVLSHSSHISLNIQKNPKKGPNFLTCDSEDSVRSNTARFVFSQVGFAHFYHAEIQQGHRHASPPLEDHLVLIVPAPQSFV